MISRLLQSSVLEAIGVMPAVAITGARQTGKTTLAKMIRPDLPSASHYLDLEYPEDQAKLQDPAFYLQQYEEDCVILDEIQYMPELFPVLRSLIDRNRIPGRFLLLGSASPSLIRESAESLAGRIAYLELHPLNLLEVKDQQNWKTLFFRGGFPNSLLADSARECELWRNNFIKTYLERELPLLGLNTDVRLMRKLMLLLVRSQSHMLNLQNFASSLGITGPTVARYIDFLERSYMVNRLEPYYKNIKKRLVKSPKIYLSDSGLMHSLLGVSDYENLINHPSVGPSWEGFVINQTRSLLPDYAELWFFRTHEGAEADMVVSIDDRPLISAEIKWTNAPKVSRGFRNVMNDLGTERNYVVTPEADTYMVSEGITVTSLQEWLKSVQDLQRG
ncbi:MAG: ATP-binding protein [Balneolaceae bacterium]|nr:ATP-binding protein [Balneolaceae bacterium]